MIPEIEKKERKDGVYNFRSMEKYCRRGWSWGFVAHKLLTTHGHGCEGPLLHTSWTTEAFRGQAALGLVESGRANEEREDSQRAGQALAGTGWHWLDGECHLNKVQWQWEASDGSEAVHVANTPY